MDATDLAGSTDLTDSADSADLADSTESADSTHLGDLADSTDSADLTHSLDYLYLSFIYSATKGLYLLLSYPLSYIWLKG